MVMTQPLRQRTLKTFQEILEAMRDHRDEIAKIIARLDQG